jgi:hypothetical protein
MSKPETVSLTCLRMWMDIKDPVWNRRRSETCSLTCHKHLNAVLRYRITKSELFELQKSSFDLFLLLLNCSYERLCQVVVL